MKMPRKPSPPVPPKRELETTKYHSTGLSDETTLHEVLASFQAQVPGFNPEKVFFRFSDEYCAHFYYNEPVRALLSDEDWGIAMANYHKREVEYAENLKKYAADKLAYEQYKADEQRAADLRTYNELKSKLGL